MRSVPIIITNIIKFDFNYERKSERNKPVDLARNTKSIIFIIA